MTASAGETLRLFGQLRPGDRVEVIHEVKVGSRQWTTRTAGEVVQTDRIRQGLHFLRNVDDKVFVDVIVLRLGDGSLSTITLDEFTQLRKL